MGSHLVDGKFQSDKYPTCPPGKVPLSVEDPMAQDLLWQYAQRRRAVDSEFSSDLETTLLAAGYKSTNGDAHDYIIKAGNDVLVWIEAGTEMPEGAAKLVRLYEIQNKRRGRSDIVHWSEVDGHRWCWSGMQWHATRFTWTEARDVVWNKLKTCTHGPLGHRHPVPLADRWAHKLVRLVPRGDTIRPRRGPSLGTVSP